MPFHAASWCRAVPLVLFVSACTAIEKSENVLAPTVAGPIPGVSIGMPVPLDPKDGRNIESGNQPITLVVQNAPTNGERPLNYLFELATDTSFTNRIFVRENIQPGADGRTSLRLSEALPTGRSYFWRARAQDGANTGLYSGFAHFNIYTPINIDRPLALSPANNFMLDSLAAVFAVGNAARSGPVGAISYILEMADSDTFANKFAIWTFAEQPGQTRFTAPSQLPNNKQLFWRVRAYDTNGAGGDWSSASVFRTPNVIAPPAPTPVPGAGGGAACNSSQPLQILQCRRNQYGAHMNATQLVEFLKASARDINRAGTAGGPWGILVKASGAQCNGYSCDILCLGNGGGQLQRDVLIDAEGAQVPIWGNPLSGGAIAVRPCEPQP